jgi:hypothetical protein
VVGVLSGTLSRITGDASVDVNSLVDGAYKFYGRCKPASCLSGVCSANVVPKSPSHQPAASINSGALATDLAELRLLLSFGEVPK